jgi:hypothetical protein
MGSVVRRVRKRKKSRRLGQVKVIDRSEYDQMELDSRVELILQLIPLGLMHVREVLEQEVKLLAGEKHVRKGVEEVGRRHGTNPGSVRMDGQRMAIEVPRVRGDRGEIPLRAYQTLHAGGGEVDEVLLRRVLYGRGDPRSDWSVEFLGVALVCGGQRLSTSRVPRSGSVRRGLCRDLSGWQEVCGGDDGDRDGRNHQGREAVSGIRRDGDGEREGALGLSSIASWSRSGHLGGDPGDHRWWEGSSSSGAPGVQESRGGAAVYVAQAGECGQLSTEA